MAGANTLEFSDQSFESEVLNASTPVLVDFWAEWCAPCKALGPVIDDLANDYAGRVKIGKVNTDHCPSMSVRFSVSSIPTVILFNNGQIVDRFIGLQGKKVFQAAIDKLTTK